jgi:hypothetical protein
MGPDPIDVTDPGLIVPVMVLVQEKVVPDIVAEEVKVKSCPLHICCDKVETTLFMTGTGLTVAVTLCVGPGHPFAQGVMVY